MNYTWRLKQRVFLFRIGFVFLWIGVLTFAITGIIALLNVNLPNLMKYLIMSLGILVLGTLFTLVFSRLGWHHIFVLDIFLNQVGFVFTVWGVIKIFTSGEPNKQVLVYLVCVLFGLILTGLGIKFSTKIN